MAYTYVFFVIAAEPIWGLKSFSFLCFHCQWRLSSEFSCQFCWEHTKWSITGFAPVGSVVLQCQPSVLGCARGVPQQGVCARGFLPKRQAELPGGVRWDCSFLIQSVLAITTEFLFSLMEFGSNVHDTTNHLSRCVSLVRRMLRLPSSFQSGTGEQRGV